MSKDDENDDEDESEESIASDGESHDLRLPLVQHIRHDTCRIIFDLSLWVLLIFFQGIGVGWLILLGLFYNESPSFVTWYMSASMGACGVIEILYDGFITTLCVIQLLQKGTYTFVHKARLLFHVAIGSFLSHLIVFLAFALIAYYKLPDRLRKDIGREIIKQRGRVHHQHPLHELFERTQEKYKCCGFGDAIMEYETFPPNCCPKDENCTKNNVFRKNCYTSDMERGAHFMIFGIILLGTSLPFAILLYFGFRYYRTYWRLYKKISEVSGISTIEEALSQNSTGEDLPTEIFVQL